MKYFTRQQILDIFRKLAMSEDFYERLLRNIYKYKEWGNAFLNDIESKHFTDKLDVILYVEGVD